jgi:hypothetical protein
VRQSALRTLETPLSAAWRVSIMLTVPHFDVSTRPGSAISRNPRHPGENDLTAEFSPRCLAKGTVSRKSFACAWHRHRGLVHQIRISRTKDNASIRTAEQKADPHLTAWPSVQIRKRTVVRRNSRHATLRFEARLVHSRRRARQPTRRRHGLSFSIDSRTMMIVVAFARRLPPCSAWHLCVAVRRLLR